MFSICKRTMLPSFLSANMLLAGTAPSSLLERLQSRATTTNPAIAINFPDPATLRDTDGTWYAFATSGNGKNVQSASAPDISGPWTVLRMIFYRLWEPGQMGQTFGPQTFHKPTLRGHCNFEHTPQRNTIACDISAGGAIDPSGFTDTDGTPYVVYKVDGNSVGHGGVGGNTVDPIVPTPLMLQQLEADGVTPVGDPIELLDRGDADGPLIEAPAMILVNGAYILFFSSNYYSTPQYDISYATASSFKGPFTKSSAPLAVTGNPFNLTAPGGSTATDDGKNMVFHANCDAGRCMYETTITVSGTTVSIP